MIDASAGPYKELAEVTLFDKAAQACVQSLIQVLGIPYLFGSHMYRCVLYCSSRNVFYITPKKG
jgi:hypothetical protein